MFLCTYMSGLDYGPTSTHPLEGQPGQTKSASLQERSHFSVILKLAEPKHYLPRQNTPQAPSLHSSVDPTPPVAVVQV